MVTQAKKSAQGEPALLAIIPEHLLCTGHTTGCFTGVTSNLLNCPITETRTLDSGSRDQSEHTPLAFLPRQPLTLRKALDVCSRGK